MAVNKIQMKHKLRINFLAYTMIKVKRNEMKDQFQFYSDSKIIKMNEFRKCTATLYQSMQRSLATHFEQNYYLTNILF